MNGINKVHERLPIRSTPSPTPPAAKEPPQPKKNLVKVLYDFDGGEQKFAITKDEILEKLENEVNGTLMSVRYCRTVANLVIRLDKRETRGP